MVPVDQSRVSLPEASGLYGITPIFSSRQSGSISRVLHSHWKETSSQDNFTQVYEVTESLSSINQAAEIKLPADMTKMVEAAKLPVEIGLPLPTGSALYGMIRYKSGIGVDLYQFTTPKIGIDEFLDYYRNLPTTDGWEVKHIGHVNLHQDDCEFTRECVIISKGSTQVVLYYNGGSIRAEFDWPHLYSPLAAASNRAWVSNGSEE